MEVICGMVDQVCEMDNQPEVGIVFLFVSIFLWLAMLKIESS